jgi:hypothetical protein
MCCSVPNSDHAVSAQAQDVRGTFRFAPVKPSRGHSSAYLVICRLGRRKRPEWRGPSKAVADVESPVAQTETVARVSRGAGH